MKRNHLKIFLSLLSFAAPLIGAQAADLYWRVDNVNVAINTSNWNTAPAAPYNQAWIPGANINFTANSRITYVDNTLIGNISVTGGSAVTWTPAGTLNTGGNVITVDVGALGSFNFGNQIMPATGTGFIKNGDGILSFGSISGGYLGGFSLNAGTVAVINSSAFGAGTLTINGGTIQSGGQNFANAVTIGGNFTLTGNGTGVFSGNADLGASTRILTNNISAGTRNFTNVISGSGGLTLAGTGSTILSGVNTYAGDTTINSGAALTLGNAGATGSLASTSNLINDGVLTINRTGTISQGANFALISGTGSITKTGSATLLVNAANTYSGGTTLTAGVLQIGGGNVGSVGAITSSAIGTGTLTLNSGTISSDSTTARTILNAITVGGTLILGNSINNGKLTFSAATNLGGAVQTLTVNSEAQFDGIISSGGLSKGGTAILTLNGANTYSGGTILGAGALQIGTSSVGSVGAITSGALGTSGLNVAAATSTISSDSTTARSVLNAITLSAAASSTLNLGGTTNTGKLTFGADVDLGGQSRTFATASDAKFDGVLSNGTLLKSGSAVLTLTQANTYNGGTTLSAGTLQVENNAALGSGGLLFTAGTLQAGTSAVTLANTSTLTALTISGSQNLSVTGKLTGTAGSSRTLTNNIVSGKVFTLGAVDINPDTGFVRTFTIAGTGDTTIGGIIANGNGTTANNLLITNTGTTTLSAANTYTGTTVVGTSGGDNAGTLKLSGSGIISNNATTIYGGTLDLNGTTQTIGQLNLGGGSSTSVAKVELGSGTLNLGGSVVLTGGTVNGASISGGTINLNANRVFNINDSVTSDAELVISSVIANGSATSALTKGLAGTLILTGANTYTGGTTINNVGSILQLGNGGASGSLSATGAVTLNGDAFVINRSNTATQGTDFGAIASGSGTFRQAGTGTTNLTLVNGWTGAVSVTNGTLVVSGTGTINGSSGVSVSGGKLRYDSSTALSKGVTVTNGATFAYNSSANYSGALTLTDGKLGGTNWSGTLGGLTIGANQTLTPGNSPGIANTTSQTWASLGSYDWEINNANGGPTASAGINWDLVNLSGALTISSDSTDRFTINVISLTAGNVAGNATNFDASQSYSWLLADAGVSITTFSADKFFVDTTGFSNTFSGIFSVVLGDTVAGGDGTQLYLTYAAIPEPSSSSLLLGGAVAAFFLFRRRRRA